MPKPKPILPHVALHQKIEILVNHPEGSPLKKGDKRHVKAVRLITNFMDMGYRPPRSVPKWIIRTDDDWEITEDQCVGLEPKEKKKGKSAIKDLPLP